MDKKSAKNTAKAAAEGTATTVGGVFRVILKILLTVLLIFITTALLFTCIFAYYVKTNLSQNLDVTLEEMSLNLASTIYYTDDNGNAVEMASLSSTDSNRVWVEGENIPDYMAKAAVAIEDKRFYEHKGVDWYRTFGAFMNMFVSMRNDFGGSTITQQLIKNLTNKDEVTVQRKLLEIFRALELERQYSKDEIMNWYLNVIYLGESCYGVGTAAQTYFGKDVWDLDLAECACIIGITNNPSKYDPYISRSNNKERQELILAEMYDQGYITNEEYTQAKDETLVFKRAEGEEYAMTINSWYTDNVIRDVIADLQEKKGVSKEIAQNMVYSGGLQIYSCYDPKAQSIVDELYSDPANFPTVKNKYGESLQSACVVLDPYTGAISAMVGGIGEKTGNLVYDRSTIAQRPAGSSIKPLATYGPAIDQGLITPSTLVNDAGNIKLSGTNWFPNNAGGGHSGIVTIQTALINSLNTVSAQILDKLGVQVSYDYLTQRLGFTSLVPEDKNYAPLALGQFTNGVTVREMAQGFDAFVNDGVFTYARTYDYVTDSDGNMVLENDPETIVAFKANTAWTMTYMLNKAATYGTGSESYIGNMPHAGKTGSSTNYQDRWFVGYTPYYVCAVWTGYDTPAYMSVSGNPSAKTWKTIMSKLNEGLPYKEFPTPTLGAATNIFGDLTEEEEEPDTTDDEAPASGTDVSPSPGVTATPSASPSPGVTPTVTPPPQVSVPVDVDVTPAA